MTAYSTIDEVGPSAEFGNSGRAGWGFVLWTDRIDDEAPHRDLLERFARAHPAATLTLPSFWEREDLIQGSLKWADQDIRVWYETILSHLSFWALDRAIIERLRQALIPLANAQP